jgi:hypothetical protein
MVINPDLE